MVAELDGGVEEGDEGVDSGFVCERVYGGEGAQVDGEKGVLYGQEERGDGFEVGVES